MGVTTWYVLWIRSSLDANFFSSEEKGGDGGCPPQGGYLGGQSKGNQRGHNEGHHLSEYLCAQYTSEYPTDEKLKNIPEDTTEAN